MARTDSFVTPSLPRRYLPIRPQLEARDPRPARLTGQVIDTRSGLPVQGLAVVGRHIAAGGDAPGEREQTATGAHGRFALAFPEALHESRARESQASVLHIEILDDDGSHLTRHTVRGPAATTNLVIEVELPRREPDAGHWAAMAERLQQAGVEKVSDVARHLTVVPRSRALFGDWDRSLRFGVIDALEQAFVDPDGDLAPAGRPLPSLRQLQDERTLQAVLTRAFQTDADGLRAPGVRAMEHVRGYANLLEIHRPLDTAALADARIGRALVAGWEQALASAKDLAAVLGRKVYDRDLVAYRDYLRDIVAPDGASDPNVEALEERFHQNFRTRVTGESPLNELLATLLKKILVAPGDAGYGFGVDASSIEDQGDRTDRQYLDYLIDTAPVGREELEKRYRLHLDRTDAVLSSPVQLNIGTLQGLLRDAPHSIADPHPKVPPAAGSGAPFFLYYDEWLPRQEAFHPENHWNIERTFTTFVPDSEREKVREFAPESTQTEPNEGWFRLMLDAEEMLWEANADAERGEWGLAQKHYAEAGRLGRDALDMSTRSKRARTLAGAGKDYDLGQHVGKYFGYLHSWPVTDEAELRGLAHHLLARHYEKGYLLDSVWFEHEKGYTAVKSLEYFLLNRFERLQFQLLRLNILIVPARLGDMALAAGDYVGAMEQYGRVSRFVFAKADSWDDAGTFAWGPSQSPSPAQWWPLLEGSLPWSGRKSLSMGSLTGGLNWDIRFIDGASHPVERRMFRVRHGAAMVEWADALYRTGVDAKVQRARELYKGAFLVHGSNPPVSPRWKRRFFHLPGWKLTLTGSANPAVVSQKNRARQGLLKIDAGLDAYGTDDSVVPSLRYSTLKAAADRFAAAAHSAQADLLLYLEQFEAGLKEELTATHLLNKARVQSEIAGEQFEIAKLSAQQAKLHLGTLEAEYDATYKKLRDMDNGLKPVIELFGGIIGGMISSGKDPAKIGVSGGEKKDEVGGIWGWLGYTGSVLGLGAMYMYYGISTIETMEGTRDGLRARMKALREVAIPIAEAQVEIHQREAKIASLEGESAVLDAIHARNLLEFQQARLLSTDFWQDFSTLMRRVLHRYLELGARAAWLAERALAFELGRAFDIIRLDYFPKDKGYATGADLLKLDLAELEAARLAGLEKALPVQRRLSLAFDFPTAFLELKATGRCSFSTSDQPFVAAAPGTYGHRIRAVTVHPRTLPATPPANGLLSNDGVSAVRNEDESYRTAVREADALPISEFTLKDDMDIHGLPDQALMSFEGSGLNTTWHLELPATANPRGLGHLLDVELELDVRAFYSAALHENDLQNPPALAPRMLVASAEKVWPEALTALRDSTGAVQLSLALDRLPLADGGTMGGLVLALLGPDTYDGPATVSLGTASAAAQLESGADGTSFAAPDAETPVAPRPLDALLGTGLSGDLVVAIDPGNFPGGRLESVTDLLVGIVAVESV